MSTLNATFQSNSSELKAFYDTRYSKGYMSDWDIAKRKRVLNIVKNLGLPDTGKALDFGCGNGIFTAVLKEALPSWDVFGTDLSSQSLANARIRFPTLNFFELSDCDRYNGKFDFILTHHVLEHVLDLEETWRTINNLLKESSKILHILPCGNPGSLEYKISLLIKNGIDETNGRFFFEEPGHLRRLTTAQVNELAQSYEFSPLRAFYSNHFWASVEEITSSPRFVLQITDLTRAKDKESALELGKIRVGLILASLARIPAKTILTQRNLNSQHHSVLAAALTVFLLPLCAISLPFNSIMAFMSKYDWKQLSLQSNGGEMYLIYERQPRLS
jgi:SAM-dependent methyltransferase